VCQLQVLQQAWQVSPAPQVVRTERVSRAVTVLPVRRALTVTRPVPARSVAASSARSLAASMARVLEPPLAAARRAVAAAPVLQIRL